MWAGTHCSCTNGAAVGTRAWCSPLLGSNSCSKVASQATQVGQHLCPLTTYSSLLLVRLLLLLLLFLPPLPRNNTQNIRTQLEGDFSLANFGFFLSAWDAQLSLDQDLLAGKCLLADQEHKLFTFADRKVCRVCGGGGMARCVFGVPGCARGELPARGGVLGCPVRDEAPSLS